MGHTYSDLLCHVVFSTKERRAAICESWRQRLYEYMAGIARQEFGHALRIGGTDDHVHGLLKIKPSISVSEAMSKWKSLSSGWVHRAVPGGGGFAWQSGYGAFSVSHSNAGRVIGYVDRQAAHHNTRNFEEEFIALLARHGVDHDPERLWG